MYKNQNVLRIQFTCTILRYFDILPWKLTSCNEDKRKQKASALLTLQTRLVVPVFITTEMLLSQSYLCILRSYPQRNSQILSFENVKLADVEFRTKDSENVLRGSITY